jgi:hypothetical protein
MDAPQKDEPLSPFSEMPLPIEERGRRGRSPVGVPLSSSIRELALEH